MADVERGDSAVVANAEMLDKAPGVRVYVTGSWACAKGAATIAQTQWLEDSVNA